MACNNCNKGIGVEYNESFRCLFCKEEAIAEPRHVHYQRYNLSFGQ